VKPKPTLPRTGGIAMLDPETAEDLDPAVIHSNRYGELAFPHGLTEEIPHCRGQIQHIRDPVELELSHRERVERPSSHQATPCFKEPICRCLSSYPHPQDTVCRFACQDVPSIGVDIGHSCAYVIGVLANEGMRDHER
jgi:hypothetical protein